jgi:hypothetical protein
LSVPAAAIFIVDALRSFLDLELQEGVRECASLTLKR